MLGLIKIGRQGTTIIGYMGYVLIDCFPFRSMWLFFFVGKW